MRLVPKWQRNPALIRILRFNYLTRLRTSQPPSFRATGRSVAACPEPVEGTEGSRGISMPRPLCHCKQRFLDFLRLRSGQAATLATKKQPMSGQSWAPGPCPDWLLCVSSCAGYAPGTILRSRFDRDRHSRSFPLICCQTSEVSKSALGNDFERHIELLWSQKCLV